MDSYSTVDEHKAALLARLPLPCCREAVARPVYLRTLAEGEAFRLHGEAEVFGRVTRAGFGKVTTVRYTRAPRHVTILNDDGTVAREFDAKGGWHGVISAGTLVHRQEKDNAELEG